MHFAFNLCYFTVELVLISIKIIIIIIQSFLSWFFILQSFNPFAPHLGSWLFWCISCECLKGAAPSWYQTQPYPLFPPHSSAGTVLCELLLLYSSVLGLLSPLWSWVHGESLVPSSHLQWCCGSRCCARLQGLPRRAEGRSGRADLCWPAWAQLMNCISVLCEMGEESTGAGRKPTKLLYAINWFLLLLGILHHREIWWNWADSQFWTLLMVIFILRGQESADRSSFRSPQGLNYRRAA